MLKRELSVIITREMKFEKGLVTINQVDVTSDLKNAHVFVSVLGTTGASVINQLEAHRAALQSAVAKHVVLKYTPHLVFHLDDSIERGVRVIGSASTRCCESRDKKNGVPLTSTP